MADAAIRAIVAIVAVGPAARRGLSADAPLPIFPSSGAQAPSQSLGRVDVWVPFDAKQKSSHLLRSDKFSVFSFQKKTAAPSGVQFRT
jgi:hypothetical protein